VLGEAERDLQEALGKDAKDADTLANLITVSLPSTRRGGGAGQAAEQSTLHP
jgi:hypothetical protein